MIRSDEEISIRRAISIKDLIFVRTCMKDKLFHLYIKKYKKWYFKYYVISYKGERLGIFSKNFSNYQGIRMYSPCLFVKKRLASLFCITAMIKWITKKNNWDKITFLVYENNANCIQTMEKLNICCEGKIHGVDCACDVIVFSILHDEVDIIKNTMKAMITRG